MRKVTWVAMGLGLSSVLFTAQSRADGPATAGVIQLGLGFRYGVELNDGDFNPWGTGLGLEAGYTLPVLPIYVGGNAEYFFGNTTEAGGVKVDGNLWQLTAEGGYDVGLGDHLVLRPKLGVGIANLSAETCLSGFGCSKDTSSKAVLAPGAKVILMLPRFLLSFDGRYEVILSDPTAKAFIFSFGIGF